MLRKLKPNGWRIPFIVTLQSLIEITINCLWGKKPMCLLQAGQLHRLPGSGQIDKNKNPRRKR
jgi:hypothetical protein